MRDFSLEAAERLRFQRHSPPQRASHTPSATMVYAPQTRLHISHMLSFISAMHGLSALPRLQRAGLSFNTRCRVTAVPRYRHVGLPRPISRILHAAFFAATPTPRAMNYLSPRPFAPLYILIDFRLRTLSSEARLLSYFLL